MLRTRDFILLFTTVVFLVMAIGVTWFTQNDAEVQTVPNQTSEISTVSAVVNQSDETFMTREERLVALRQKIEESELVTISEPEPDVVASNTPDIATSSVALSGPLLCPNYQPLFITDWPIETLETVAVEGVRQYFTVETRTVTQGTTTSEVVTKDVRLELPMRAIPLGQPSCIPHDVIGVALDGSLIRNGETGLYSIFTSETLVGYALDGFPIYGSGTLPTDSCGGRIEGGLYRYELTTERAVILNCFASLPQSII